MNLLHSEIFVHTNIHRHMYLYTYILCVEVCTNDSELSKLMVFLKITQCTFLNSDQDSYNNSEIWLKKCIHIYYWVL